MFFVGVLVVAFVSDVAFVVIATVMIYFCCYSYGSMLLFLWCAVLFCDCHCEGFLMLRGRLFNCMQVASLLRSLPAVGLHSMWLITCRAFFNDHPRR